MSGCGWRAYLAIGGLALVLAGPVLGQEQDQTQDTPPAERTASEQAPGEPPAPPERLEKPDPYERLCEEAQTAEDRDLCQQWRMAEATERQAGLAFWQIVVTAIEIAALVATVGVASWSAFAASDAARATRQSNDIARESAHRQLRAYITLDSDSFEVGGEAPKTGPVVRATMVNSGQTPAYDLSHWIGIGFFEVPLSRELPQSKAGPAMTLGPGARSDFVVEKQTTLTDDQIKALISGKGGVYVWGRIEYRDAFGASQFVNLRLVSTDLHKPGGSFRRLPDGNDAS